MATPLHILLLTNLYPNNVQVRQGAFIRERLRHLLKHKGLRVSIIAPVPWFPFSAAVFGRYGRFTDVHDVELDFGIKVYHPRYLVLPKIGDFISPVSYAAAVSRCIRRNSIDAIDVIDAHFFFPDGAAAVLLANSLHCPVSVTARGTDINQMPAEFFAGRWIRWCAKKCDAAVAVSEPLSRKLLDVGASVDKVHVIPNGVDGALFEMRNREHCRHRLGVRAPLVISVGNLVGGKGHQFVIEAVAGIKDTNLVIVGNGPMRKKLEETVQSNAAEDRVRIVGELRQSDLIDYYNAADVLVLASASEGMPNVVLESMSCGTPVVATAVGGLEDFLATSHTARTLQDCTPAAIADALTRTLNDPPDRRQVRAEVASMNWNDTSNAICDLLRGLAPAAGDCVHREGTAQDVN